MISLCRKNLQKKTPVKIIYDPEVDVLRILFRPAPIKESDGDKPGVILDYDRDGNIVGLEILDASKRVENPRSVEYSVLEVSAGTPNAG